MGPPGGLPGMGPPGGLPGMGPPGGLPGMGPPGGAAGGNLSLISPTAGPPNPVVRDGAFDFSQEEIYKFVSNMEEFLLSKKGKLEPFKLASQLGFSDPEILYNFIVNLNREDLIKFDGGKIVVDTSMSPVDTEEFLKKFENYLKTGRV